MTNHRQEILRKSPYSGPTILSAATGDNSDLFPRILELYSHPGAMILDATFGRGNFWKKTDIAKYQPLTSDVITNANFKADFSRLPLRDGILDLFILDPPYMHAGSYKSIKRSIANCYQSDTAGDGGSSTHEANVRMYQRGIDEARRTLKPGGFLVLKGMDEIESGKQRLFLTDFFQTSGFIVEDVFILVRKSKPCIRWPYQYHSRKNYSYFLVLRRHEKSA